MEPIESYRAGVDKLVDGATEDYGLVMEGSSADYEKHRHCHLYTVGNFQDRMYAVGLPKGEPAETVRTLWVVIACTSNVGRANCLVAIFLRGCKKFCRHEGQELLPRSRREEHTHTKAAPDR